MCIMVYGNYKRYKATCHINLILQVFTTDRSGKTGLHIAASHGHYDMVAQLMGNGAELGTKDKVNI